MTQYQPNWINGEESPEFQRDCKPRYEIIRAYLKKTYERPFSCIDIGANYGYFGFRLAADFDCVSVMVDTKPIGKLLEKNHGKLIWLDKRIETNELQLLAKCESFDVVLVLSVIHHFTDWKRTVDALLELGKTVIFELPGHGETHAVNYPNHEAISKYILGKDHEVLMEMASHVNPMVLRKMVVLRDWGISIRQQTIDAGLRQAPLHGIQVCDSNDRKSVIKHNIVRPFIHGMNLWNFKLLNGQYPKNIKQMVKDALKELPRFHDDLRPWNFIIDGEKCHAIDYDEKKWRKAPEKKGLENCLKLLEMDADYSNENFTKLFRTA